MPTTCSPRLSCFPPLLSCFTPGQPAPPARGQQRNNKQLPGPELLLLDDWEDGGEDGALSPFSAPQQQAARDEPSSSSLTDESEPESSVAAGAGAGGGAAGPATRASGSLLSPVLGCFSGGQSHSGAQAQHARGGAAVSCLPAVRGVVGSRRWAARDVHRLPGPLSPLPEDEPLADEQPTVVNGWVPTLEQLLAAEDITYRTGYSRASPTPSTLADEFCSFTTSQSNLNVNAAAAGAGAGAGGAAAAPHSFTALQRSPTSTSIQSSSGVGVVKQNSCGSEDSGLSFSGPPGSRLQLPLPPSTPSTTTQNGGVSSVGEWHAGAPYEQDAPNPVAQLQQHVPSKLNNLAGGATALPSRATSLTTAREGSRVSVDGGSEVNAEGQYVRTSSQARAAAPEQVQLQDEEETASQQADRLYTYEVLENFRQQPPHSEPRTGVVFPGTCCDINLAGVGVRAKRLFGSEINVYALGVYVDGEGARRELTEAFARNPSRDTLGTEFIISETMRKAIRIVMTLSVSQSQFMGALEERMVPLLKAAKAMHLLDQLRVLLSGVSYSKGTEVVISTVEGGVLTIMVNRETKGVLQSLLLCRSLYDVWLGKDTVAPDLRESFLDTMEKLIATPRN